MGWPELGLVCPGSSPAVLMLLKGPAAQHGDPQRLKPQHALQVRVGGIQPLELPVHGRRKVWGGPPSPITELQVDMENAGVVALPASNPVLAGDSRRSQSLRDGLLREPGESGQVYEAVIPRVEADLREVNIQRLVS